MSVTGPAANITAIERLSEHELKHGITGEASWHHRYKDSCYIYIGMLGDFCICAVYPSSIEFQFTFIPGGLNKRMTEGDIIIVFSQFGEPIDIHLVRDRKTGMFCFPSVRVLRGIARILFSWL